jgi:hydroxylamine reductase (hybrid-cluster protein)
VHSVHNVSFWFTRRADSFEGFVGNLLRSEPGSAQVTNKWFVASWNCTGLSGRDLWKKIMEDESIEGNVQAMESNEGRRLKYG